MNSKRNDRKGGKFTFKQLEPYEVDNLADHGLASLNNQKGNVFKKRFNKLLKIYIVSDDDRIYNDKVNITKQEQVVEFSKSCYPNNESNESINLWNKLPDEIFKTILLNSIGSSSNAIEDYHSIIQICSTLQIVKQKGKRLLPHVYIDTNENFEHFSFRNMIKVIVRKLTKLFGQNSGLLLDIS